MTTTLNPADRETGNFYLRIRLLFEGIFFVFVMILAVPMVAYCTLLAVIDRVIAQRQKTDQGPQSLLTCRSISTWAESHSTHRTPSAPGLRGLARHAGYRRSQDGRADAFLSS